ncbi:Galactose oxidase/kelch, beta-propeller [Penicillium griseofulvum]|uniref:Galactose oxidase/kelch, beta-propeller n=1 Tax=Penicillium patulum TaxID=5078 RepID=A0A135L9U4_PENPA|nr:Galactose oxidase/kelch, beta-propeller [Penicillium griseofulvum]KXG45650.1 Galactose oxidase/kelch, beta-propeller [Penicillium griseofulvum]
MKGPRPIIKIEGDCSTIHDDTLYVYSPDGFASIPLKENAKWEPHPSPDHIVTNPACVQGSGGDFYLVGGTGSPDNSGLQRFSFSTNKWETLTGASSEMKNRTGHGAGYIPSTSQILVYAGNTDGSTRISQSTLIISTKGGSFDVSSGVDQGAPALYEPIILPWSASEVAMIGGSPTNTDIFIYDSNKGFGKSEATLPSAIQASSRCALASESGGKTKVLEEFTMIASPNTVTGYLLSSKGKIQNPATVIAPSEKRDITDSYNGTFAPTASWSDYTLAQGGGLVVLASGQSSDSLAIFNQTSNAWVNSTELFYGKPDQNVLKATSTSFTSSTPTPTSTSSTSTSTTASATPTSSSPVVAAVSSGLSDHGKMILGATLGSVLGFGLILLILLFLLRREKKKKQATQPGGGGDNKDRLSFQDQGIEPLTEGAYPMARSPVPLAATSVDSLAIMSGRYKGEKSLKPPSSTGYGLSPQPKASSPLSTIPSSGVMGASSVYTEDTNRAGDDTGRENQAADRMTDEGWGKYFEDGGTTNFQSDRSTISSAYTKSDYRGSGWPMSTLTPLNFGFLEQPKPLGRVPSGSPTTEHGPPDMGSRSLVIPESQSARISSADSISVASDDDRDDSRWQGAHQSSWLGRPSSSNYTTSFYQTSTQDMPWESSNPSLADKPKHPNARRSSVIIPHDIDELPVQGQKNTTNSDMSWLNLKADR